MTTSTHPVPPLSRSATAILSALLFGTAWGQASQTPPAADVVELPPVTVTARKREESVQNVPISMTVQDAQALERNAAPADGNAGLAGSTPNLSFADSGGLNSNLFTIRGVGSFAPLSSDDTSVVMSVNEVPRSVYGAPPTLLDVNRVEVLRGPQGTLFGRNTQGGAINVIQNEPQFERALSATAELGSHGHRLGEIVGNAPLSDALAGRLALRYTHLDPTVPNVSTLGKDGRVQVGAARGSLLWLPDDDTAVTFSGFYDRRQSDAPRFLWWQNPSFPQSAIDPRGDVRWRDAGASVKVEHDAARVRLTSLTSYQDSLSTQALDLTDALLYSAMTGAPQAAYNIPYADYTHFRYHEKTLQQELRLSSLDDAAPLTWTAGVNVFRSDFTSALSSRASPAAFNFSTQNGAQDNRHKTTSMAVFGEGTLALTERFKTALGLRYTRETKNADYQFRGNGHPAVVGFFEDSQRLTDNFLTGRAGIAYDWSPDLMSYATVSRGAISAGFPAQGVNIQTGKREAVYPTSTSWTYEAGFKSSWLDRRLDVNGSVFYNDVTNGHMLVFDPTQALFTTASLDYRSKGVELEAAARMSKTLTLTAAVGYTDAELVNVPADSATGAKSGNRVPNVPRLSSSLGMQVASPMRLGALTGRLKASVAWQYLGRRAVDVRNSFNLPGYGIVNARIGWQQGNWEIYSFAWNVFDKQYVVAGQAWTPTVSSVRVGQPRIIGLGATVRF